MSNKPQVKTEEIELIPHPMDAWRAALDLLIACAPGDGPAIAAHLVEASKAALVCVNRTGATPGVAKMIDRMMLIGSARIVGARLDQQPRNEQGFTHLAPLLHTAHAIGGSRGHQPAAQPGTALPGVHAAQTLRRPNAQPVNSALSTQAPAAAGSPALPPCAAMPEPGRESAPPSAASESRERPSDDSSR